MVTDARAAPQAPDPSLMQIRFAPSTATNSPPAVTKAPAEPAAPADADSVRFWAP